MVGAIGELPKLEFAHL